LIAIFDDSQKFIIFSIFYNTAVKQQQQLLPLQNPYTDTYIEFYQDLIEHKIDGTELEWLIDQYFFFNF